MPTEEKVRQTRLLMIDEALRSNRYPNARTLAETTEVSERTILRDLDYLRDMYRAPIEYDPQKRGFYYTERNFFIKSVLLSEGELFSLALFDHLLEQYRNTPLEKSLRVIFAKIVASMPEKVTADFGFLSAHTTFIPDHAPAIDADVFRTVFTALQTSHTVTFDYRSLRQNTYAPRRIDPYHAICQKGNWYIIGYCRDRKEPRMFSLSRIKAAKLTKGNFAIPAGFDPKAYFDPAVGVWASSRNPVTVELLFTADVATFALEQRWHDTQTVRQNADGTVYVSFTTTQTPEILRWVLAQGRTVKVLGPAELVHMIKDEAVAMSALYR